MQLHRRHRRCKSMDPEVIAAMGFFGAIVVCPLVFLLMKHQRTMAEIIHRAPAQDLNGRIEALEREVWLLRSNQTELGRRVDDLPQPASSKEIDS